MHSVSLRLRPQPENYDIKIGASLISQLGAETRARLGPESRQAVLISNQTVFDLFGLRAARSLRASGFKVCHWLMKDGERYKSLQSLEQALKFLSQSRVEQK